MILLANYRNSKKRRKTRNFKMGFITVGGAVTRPTADSEPDVRC